MTLWSYTDLVVATGGRLVGRPSRATGGVSIDTRTLRPGDIFFAIRGDNSDGHDHVLKALEGDAAIAVVAEERLANLPAAGPYLAVSHTLGALVGLGRASRARSAARIAAVTGSVGKTTTKEALALALASSGPTHASVASYNNHWGVPLTLARMPADTAYGVFEIGMNHAGEITPLTGMVRPHVAVVTNVAPVHIEHFDGRIEGIADAKAEIFSGLEAGGTAVINRDDAQFERLSGAARALGFEVVGFGASPEAEVRLIDQRLGPDLSYVEAEVLGERVAYRVGAPGGHVVQNTLAVLAAVKLLGADLALGALALANLSPPKGRGVRTRLAHPDGGAITLIDEAYNANPASMAAALRLAASVEPGPGGRRIAVLGDMLELGEIGPTAHAALADVLGAAGFDQVWLCGPLMEHLWRALPDNRRGGYQRTSAELEQPLLMAVRPGDVIVVKGSLGSRMMPIVDAFKSQFPAAGADA